MKSIFRIFKRRPVLTGAGAVSTGQERRGQRAVGWKINGEANPKYGSSIVKGEREGDSSGHLAIFYCPPPSPCT